MGCALCSGHTSAAATSLPVSARRSSRPMIPTPLKKTPRTCTSATATATESLSPSRLSLKVPDLRTGGGAVRGDVHAAVMALARSGGSGDIHTNAALSAPAASAVAGPSAVCGGDTSALNVLVPPSLHGGRPPLHPHTTGATSTSPHWSIPAAASSPPALRPPLALPPVGDAPDSTPLGATFPAPSHNSGGHPSSSDGFSNASNGGGGTTVFTMTSIAMTSLSHLPRALSSSAFLPSRSIDGALGLSRAPGPATGAQGVAWGVAGMPWMTATGRKGPVFVSQTLCAPVPPSRRPESPPPLRCRPPLSAHSAVVSNEETSSEVASAGGSSGTGSGRRETASLRVRRWLLYGGTNTPPNSLP